MLLISVLFVEFDAECIWHHDIEQEKAP
jgi:hypothetical protein